MVVIEKMTEEGEGDVDADGSIILYIYSGGRAPSNIINARIDKSIDAITDGAFCDCNALEYVELHDGVMTIEKAAFHGCCSLKRIEMPSNQVFDGSSFKLAVDSFEKEIDIQEWLESIQSKIQHHTMERNKLMKEAARISCGANIEDDNVIPFPNQERSGNNNKSVSTEKKTLSSENSSPRIVAQDELVDNNCPGTCHGKDIYEYFRSKEVDTDVTTSTYMNNQPHINAAMRSILIDWLIEVHSKSKHVAATLYLTVNIVDRYLSKVTVKRSELQLVGVTALFIASKYEEIYQCELDDMVHICAGTYTETEASIWPNLFDHFS